MDKFNPFLFDSHLSFFTIIFVWCVVCFGFLLWRRKRRGLVLPKITDSNAVFTERFASGASDKSWLTRLGGASNCLTVIVNQSHVAITTFFPFTAFAGIYDLEHLIPISNITGLFPKGKFIEVEFKKNDGTRCKLFLRLRNDADFIQALETNPAINRTASTYFDEK